jgi:hypothetical protein
MVVAKTWMQSLQSWLALVGDLSAGSNSDLADLPIWSRTDDFEDFALAIGTGQLGRWNEGPACGAQSSLGGQRSPTRPSSGIASRAYESGRPASAEESSPGRGLIGSDRPGQASAVPGSAADSTVTVANGATVAIDGATARSVTFTGTTGTLKLQNAMLFSGVISGLAGADAIDLPGFAYGANVQATFLGNASGGTLTVTDGAEIAHIGLSGNYLSSTWTLSGDGKGGTTVVDPTTSTNWQTLKVGAGGFVRGLDIAPDGTMVGRTDTNGAYLWTGSAWVQLVTASSMPAAFVAANPASGQGTYEIQIAASNTNIFYLSYDGYVFKSTNRGTTWTQTSFTPVTDNASTAANDAYGQLGQKMAIDPNNPNIVYVGTPQNGMFVTTNGGQTWSSVSALPVSQSVSGVYPGITGILFDPAVGGVVSGATQTIFSSSYGHGVYESTNGGSTWTALTGGPANVEYAAVSSTGVYYAVGNGGSGLWSYASGKWTQLLSESGLQAVAVNPSNPNEIATLTSSDYLNVSYNGGATWSGIDEVNTLTSADIPWLAAADTGAPGTSNAGYAYLDIGGAAFSPTTPNELIASGGTGVWTTSVPTSGLTTNTKLTFSDMSVGIENLVANEIIVPPGGNPVLASWDRPFFYISNPNSYPSTYSPVNSDTMNEGWSIDYASSNPSFVVGIADWYGGEEQSGYSTNGGQTWATFASVTPSSGGLIGGTIAASTPQDIVWAPSGGHQPYYTLNGGSSWSPITLPGVPSWSGFDWAYYLDQRSVTADRVLANTFYLYYPGQGVFSTSNGGSSWTKVYSGTIGPHDGYNSTLMSVPSEASNLFYTGGPVGTPGSTPANEPFYRSTNGGATWTTVPNVLDVFTFGFGAAAPGQSYPAIYIVGYVNSVYGIWQSTNNAKSWTNIGTYPTGELDQIKTIAGDPNHYGEVYVGFNGGGYAYLPASSTTAPAVTGVNASPATGAEIEGDTITFAITMSEVVTVAGGTPTLTLNDGGTAKYTGGSGTDDLTFAYTVGSTNKSVANLAITAVNLPNGVTIEDSAGNRANMAGAVATFSGLSVDTITIVDTAADLQALTATQIATLSSAGVTLLEASNADVAFTTAQKEALGAAGIALEQPYSGGANEVLTYYSSGVLKTAQYLGIVGRPYTSYTETYGANGKPTSASYSNGMTATWTYNADKSYDIAYAGVTGQPYSSYENVYNTAGVGVTTARNMTNGSGALLLYANGQTISSSSGALRVTIGTDAFNLNPHTTEAITATGKSSETFEYASGFGQSSITGLLAGGSASDVIDLNLSMFSGLSSSNTAAQNFAAVLSSGAAAQSGSNVTITDSAHDVLTLVGVTTTTLSLNASSTFKFV